MSVRQVTSWAMMWMLSHGEMSWAICLVNVSWLWSFSQCCQRLELLFVLCFLWKIYRFVIYIVFGWKDNGSLFYSDKIHFFFFFLEISFSKRSFITLIRWEALTHCWWDGKSTTNIHSVLLLINCRYTQAI